MNSSWRVWAKVVAIFDHVLLAINLIMVLSVAFFYYAEIINDPTYNQEYYLEETPKNEICELPIWIALLVIPLDIFLSYVQVWAAGKLLASAQVGKEPHSAIDDAKTWRNVTLFFLFLGIIGCCSVHNFLLLGIVLLIRGIPLFVVCKFMNELKTFSGGCNGDSVPYERCDA